MKVYHGTGDYALKGLLTGKPIRTPRNYVRKPCFSTTLSFEIASLFAVRKSSPEDLKRGTFSGVVVEYELGGTEGQDWKHAKDPCLQEEHEVAVFSVGCLIPLAVWRNIEGNWKREAVA